MDFFFFSNILCAVNLKVLDLLAYWYTGSAFFQIPLIIFNHILAMNYTTGGVPYESQ